MFNKEMSFNNKYYKILQNIFFTYLAITPILVSIMTLLGFNKLSFKFYLLSTFIVGVYVSIDLIIEKTINYRSVLYLILCGISIYQVFIYFSNPGFYEFYEFIQFILISLIMISFLKKDNIKKLGYFISNNIRKILFSYLILIIYYIILFITRIGFKYVWEGQYFQAFFEFPHQASYQFFMIQGIGLALYSLSHKNFERYFSLIIIIVSIFMNLFTGARTSFILSLLVFVPYLFEYFKKNKKILYIYIVIILLLLLINFIFKFVDIVNIPIVKKFIYSLQGNNGLFQSREFWDDLIKYFLEHYTIRDIILGKGFGVSIYINTLSGFPGLWAHNDFIELLLSAGVIGVGLYIGILSSLFFKYRTYIVLITIVGLAFLNGFFAYAYIFPCIPIYIIAREALRKNIRRI